MKRMFCSFLIISLLVGALSLSAAATPHTGTYIHDFSSGYSRLLANDATATVTVSCDAPTIPRAETEIVIPSGCTARVTTGILYQLDECRTTDSNTVVNNKVSCTATLKNYTEVTKTYHYANRRCGDDFSYWQYYFIDPSHEG